MEQYPPQTRTSLYPAKVKIFCIGNMLAPLARYNSGDVLSIVAKKWEPGNLVPSRFSGKIRKVEARLGKLAKIRKVETD